MQVACLRTRAFRHDIGRRVPYNMTDIQPQLRAGMRDRDRGRSLSDIQSQLERRCMRDTSLIECGRLEQPRYTAAVLNSPILLSQMVA